MCLHDENNIKKTSFFCQQAEQVAFKLNYISDLDYDITIMKINNIYSFHRFMAQARSARAINRQEKNEDPYFIVRTEKRRLIRYLLYLSFCRKESISSQSRLHLNDSSVKSKKKANFIGLRKQFAAGLQRRESKLQTFNFTINSYSSFLWKSGYGSSLL